MDCRGYKNGLQFGLINRINKTHNYEKAYNLPVTCVDYIH